MNFWQLIELIQLTRSLSSASSGSVIRKRAPFGCFLQVLYAPTPVSSPDSSPPEGVPREAGALRGVVPPRVVGAGRVVLPPRVVGAGRAVLPRVVGGAASTSGISGNDSSSVVAIATGRDNGPMIGRVIIGSGSPWSSTCPCGRC